MAQYDGSIRINTKIDTKDIKKGFSGIKTGAKDLSASINGALSSLSGLTSGIGAKFKNLGSAIRGEASGITRNVNGLSDSFRRLGATIASVFAVRKITGFASSMTELGSDLEEVQNVVDVTFTTMSDKIDEFAKNAAKSAGLSETMAKRYAGAFGAMSKSFGFTEDAAYKMSTALTQLSGDVASFYNISQDEAYTKLTSVFTGETETLKGLGVVMTENALNSYAMAKGIGKTVSKMTEQEKVALRYQFVLEKLSGASGDFVRTSGSWANQMRVLKLQIESIKAAIGQGLINVLTPALKMLNTLLEKLREVAGAFKSFTESFSGKTSTGKTDSDYQKYADSSENLAGSIEGVSDAAQDAKKSLEGYLSPLDEINKYGTGKDDDLLSNLENIDFGNLENLNIGVAITPEIDESGISDKFAQMAEKIKGILQSLFNPLKEAWNREGKFVMDSWKYALDEAWDLIKNIGSDFLEVWQQEKTVTIFENLLHIIGDIGLVAGNLAKNFREAWNENETGLHILENVRDIISAIIGNIRHAADVTAEWSKKLDFSPLLAKVQEWIGSLAPVFDNLSGIIADFYEKVLLQLGKWTIEKGLPDLLQVFIDFNNKVDWQALRDRIAEFWEHLEPFAETIGEGLIIFIERVSNVLADFINSPEFDDFLTMIENWMDSVSPEDVADGLEMIAKGLIALKIAIAGFSAISAVAGVLKTLVSFGSAIAGLGSAISKGATIIATGVSNIVAALGGILPALSLVAATVVGWNIGEWINEKLLGVDTPSFFAMMDGIKSSFTDGSWKGALQLWGEDIKSAWTEIWGYVKEDFNNSILGEIIGSFTDGTWSSALALWGEDIKASWIEIWNYVKEYFQDSIIGQVVTSFTDGTWKKALSSWAGDIKSQLESVKSVWYEIWGNIKSKVFNIVNSIRGKIEDFIGKIRDAIQSVKDFFSISSKSGGAGSNSENSPTYSLRSEASPYAANPAFAKLADVEIPGYATGQVIPRTMKQHLAILGDNTRETEVVSPLSTIKQAQKESLLEALTELGLDGSSGSKTENTYNVKALANNRVLFELMIEEGKIQQMSTGINPFLLGTT